MNLNKRSPLNLPACSILALTLATLLSCSSPPKNDKAIIVNNLPTVSELFDSNNLNVPDGSPILNQPDVTPSLPREILNEITTTPPPESRALQAKPTKLASIPEQRRTPSIQSLEALATPSNIVDSTPPSPTETATYWPTVTKQILPTDIASNLPKCTTRAVDHSDLLLIVTQQFGLPSQYIPPDLVSLRYSLPEKITPGNEILIREVVVEPLQKMIQAMDVAGLNPFIQSGFRDYQEQELAWNWWDQQYPGRVAIMSAKGGHSEHQLGTTVDFAAMELNFNFHVDFANTPSGLWLANNAHLYGFVMSYPDNTYDITGFKFEPWHFRYVGIEMAQQLEAQNLTLTEWQLKNLPAPCNP